MYTFLSLILQDDRASNKPPLFICLFKYLVYFCTPGFLSLSSVSKPPLQTARIPHSLLGPHSWQSAGRSLSALSVCPTIWLTGSLWLPGTMQRPEMSLWGSSSLDHSSWGCATSWILRSLQQSSSETRWLSPGGPPCQPDFLCWGEGVFIMGGEAPACAHLVRERLLGYMDELFAFLRFPWSQFPWRMSLYTGIDQVWKRGRHRLQGTFLPWLCVCLGLTSLLLRSVSWGQCETGAVSRLPFLCSACAFLLFLYFYFYFWLKAML